MFAKRHNKSKHERSIMCVRKSFASLLQTSILNKNYECEYFDSYGRKPELCILKYISKNSKKIVYNNKCVQELWTISCGQMCLYFLTWRCRGISFKQIIKSMLSDDFINGFVDYL